MYTIDELLDILIERVDPDELVDVLGLTTEQLCQALFEPISDNREKLLEYMGIEENEE